MKGRLVGLIGLFIALSAVGAAIKIPAIIGSVALDSFPSLMAAAILGGGAGAIVGALGHMLSAMLAGFPLGTMHFLIAVEMAVLAWLFGLLYKNKKKVLASAFFIIGNSFLAPVPFIWLMSKGFYITIVPSLLVGSIINLAAFLIIFPRISVLFKERMTGKGRVKP